MRGRGLVVVATMLVVMVIGVGGPGAGAQVRVDQGAVPVATWGLGDVDPVAMAVRGDGRSYVVVRPLRTQPDFEALQLRGEDGSLVWERVVRDRAGRELRPIAVEAGGGGVVYVATADTVVALDSDGAALWDAPAGDGHPDFGPAARGLSLSAAGDLVFGTDFVNGRLLGYRVENGSLRVRLGSEGVSPGFYSGPVDVAVGRGAGEAADRIFVAERGNRRVQVLDAQGNPLEMWDLPARPRALTVVPAGDRVLVLMEDERVLALDAGDGSLAGVPSPSVGEAGDSVGTWQAQDIAATDDHLLLLDRRLREVRVYDHRRHADGGTATPGVPEPTVTPDVSHRFSVCPGRVVEMDWAVALAAAPPRADVMLVVDTTGSMESLISTAQARTEEILDGLAAVSPDVAVGLMDVRDYPYGQAGLASDWAWQLRQPLSGEAADLLTATRALWPGGGGDAPEAYAGAIAASLDDARVGWREGAQKFVVLLGDSVPRDGDLNDGVTDPLLPSPWRPGQPTWWHDSGPDWVPGTVDDLDWQGLLERLEREEVTLAAGISGAAPSELRGITGDLVRYWRDWTGRTGGTAVDLSNVGVLPGALAGMVRDGGREIDRLAVSVQPVERAGWVTALPGEYEDVGVGEGGAQRVFGLTIAPPVDTPAGSYALVLEALGDGARYARMELVLDWQPECGPTPTATLPSPTPSVTPTASETPAPTATGTPSPTREATPTPVDARAYLPALYRGYCLAQARKPADIALVLDTSSSMSGAKLAAAVRAAGTFLELVNLPRDHIAVVTFNSQASVDATLTGSQSRLALALAAPRIGQGTRIDRGIEAATAELTGPRGRAEALPVMILLTDGRPEGGTEGATRGAAGLARAAGITLFTIGLGGDVDAALLRDLAGQPARYFEAPDAEDLERIYRGLALELPCQ